MRNENLHRGCRDATSDYPLTFVDEQWLHITIAQITDTAGRLIPDGKRRHLAEELQRALHQLPPFTVLQCPTKCRRNWESPDRGHCHEGQRSKRTS